MASDSDNYNDSSDVEMNSDEALLDSESEEEMQEVKEVEKKPAPIKKKEAYDPKYAIPTEAENQLLRNAGSLIQSNILDMQVCYAFLKVADELLTIGGRALEECFCWWNKEYQVEHILEGITECDQWNQRSGSMNHGFYAYARELGSCGWIQRSLGWIEKSWQEARPIPL